MERDLLFPHIEEFQNRSGRAQDIAAQTTLLKKLDNALTQRMDRLVELYLGNAVDKSFSGRMLMDQVERWARQHGCGSVRLRSNVVRSRAHAFYERLGYEVIKTQKAFCKNLG